MSGSIIQIVAGMLITFVLVAVSGLVLFANGYQLRPKNIRLPFIDFEANRFAELSPIKLFQSVSRLVIFPSEPAKQWLAGGRLPEISPELLIETGWRIVSEAFCEEYLEYPTDDNVQAKASQIGSQNVEFVLLYRKIRETVFRFPDDLPKEFAVEYFLRAPSLATRISSRSDWSQDQFVQFVANFLPDKP
jgi:hypothetical protein